MSRQEAEDKLYSMWSDGEIPSNFDQEHSEYETAVQQMMKYGEINFSDFF